MGQAIYLEDHSDDQWDQKPRTKVPFYRTLWFYMGFLGISLAVTTIVIVFGIIPAVSRSLVASSTLTIQSLQVLDPSPTNFRLVLNSTLEHATNFVPTLDGFTSSLFLATNDSTNPVPFSTANIATFASGPTSPINLDQIEPITDLNAFTGFAKALVSSQEVSLGITGKSVLRLGALSALNVDFDKTVTMNGLNGLAGFSTTNLRLLATTATDGSNLLGDANIPNPSVMTVALGNLSFALTVKGASVGNATISNVVLVPGNNTLPLRANVVLASIVAGVDSTTGTAQLTTQLTTAVFNGQRLSYFEAALANQPLVSTVKISDVKLGATDS